MSYTQRYTEGHEITALTGVLYADSRGAGNHNTAWLSMANHQRAVFVLNVGEMQQGATLNMILQEATSAAGAGVQAIAGKAITQLTQAGGDGNDMVVIELRTEEMDVDNQYDFVRAQVVVAGAAVECSLVPYRFEANYPPVDVTAWQEIVD